MKAILVLSLIMILFSGCGKHSIHKEETKFPVGKKLFISKCGGCHRLYLRSEHSPEKWDTIVASKRKKANISLEEEKEILSFLKER